MRRLPPYVTLKTAKGREYYYFMHPSLDERGCLQYLRLPHPSDETFASVLAELNARYPRKRKAPRWVALPSWVYFIGGDIGAIKIGRAIRPKRRLMQLQMGSPIEISILAITEGGAELEAAYHSRFADTRLRGEWFARSPELMAEISRVNK